jgi:Protein of unknown function, DUF547
MKKNVPPEGKIDYATLKKSPGELLYILDNVSKINTKFEDKNTSKAFWINIYNLEIIKGVLENYPLKSVNDVPGFFKENTFKTGGSELTLDDVENTILQQIFLDTCIHFVLNSGANCGAPMLNEAYMPNKVETQMKSQAKKYINNKKVFRVNNGDKTIELPKIFEWIRKIL